ncbi:MAG: aminotransferase class V-fold PLP-dependent enzyme [Chloroflexi bacterium]|nr:aminotransferase class V-fold PLP-dependent enzyme [Chloroflexota bacterium]
MIYLDNAATSFPKPDTVVRAMSNFLERAGGNPGRSGHRLSIEAGRIVYDAREAVAELFRARDPLRVIFTLNATHALNLALRGVVRSGDRVVTTSMEHNAVMRPLRALERAGVRVIVAPCTRDGSLDLDAMYRAVEPGTRLVVVNHASNVVGTILPIAEIARLAHAAGALILVDAAQTAGVLPIDLAAMEIDLLAFTGHKGLYGPPGTGGLVFGENVDAAIIEPLWRGGTGSRSESEEQPDDLPDKFESGTPNGVGIAGLGAGARFVLERGVDAIRAHEVELTRMLIEGLQNISGVVVHGTRDAEKCTAVVSFTVEDRQVSEIGLWLDEEFGVLCRVGLHCAPAAHRTLGTFPRGTVRFAPGIFTTQDDIRVALDAVRRIVRG